MKKTILILFLLLPLMSCEPISPDPVITEEFKKAKVVSLVDMEHAMVAVPSSLFKTTLLEAEIQIDNIKKDEYVYVRLTYWDGKLYRAEIISRANEEVEDETEPIHTEGTQ